MRLTLIKYRRWHYIFALILAAVSIYSLIVFGLKPSIDFVGGSVLEMQFKDARPSNQLLQEKLKDLNLGDITLQPVGEKDLSIKTKDIDENTHQQILTQINTLAPFTETKFESIGPTIGKELSQGAWKLIVLSLLAILIYIAIAFSKVQRPLSSWQYGLISILALFFNLLVTLGAFSLLGKFYQVEVNIPFIVALLTIIGYSINDTVVVFDRTRENLLKHRSDDFEQLVNDSVNQTLSRSINTVLTVLFPLVTIYFIGGDTLKYFALALIIGISCGAYSSIFIASSLLVTWEKLKRHKK